MKNANRNMILAAAAALTLAVAPSAPADVRVHVSLPLPPAPHKVLRHLPARPAPSPAAEAIGVCDGPGARQLFFATVEQVIVPGLRAHGLDALTAWRAAQRLNA